MDATILLQNSFILQEIYRHIHGLAPHFSPAFYGGGGSGHAYCVPLRRAPRRTVKYASGALGRAPCIHTHLRRLATKPGEKCGLGMVVGYGPLEFVHLWEA